MSPVRSSHTSRLTHAIQKLFVSSFVVFSFVAYVVRDHLTNADTTSNNDDLASLSTQSQAKVGLRQVVPTSQVFTPTQQPTATDKPQDQVSDGTYVGPTVNAFYGLVQVEATIQDGKLTDVQFLQYPNDRRTSQRINSIAMPRLTSEAIQAQSAYINIVSGATLTSQAFAQSLYTILMQATS